jgi:hypothetical protein
VIATVLPASGVPVTVTVTTAGTTLQSLTLVGSGVILNAAQSLTVTGALLVQTGATFATGLAPSTAGTLAMTNAFYSVQGEREGRWRPTERLTD